MLKSLNPYALLVQVYLITMKITAEPIALTEVLAIINTTLKPHSEFR